MMLRNSVLLALVISGCATTTSTDYANAPSELATAAPALLRAWQGTDAAAFRPYYSDNVIVVTATDRYSGWNDVHSRWITPGLGALSNFRTSGVTFTREGSDIIETGRYSYRVTQEGRTQNMTGAFAQRWQRQTDGSWRVVSVNVQ